MAPVTGHPTQRLKAFYEGPYGRHVMLFHGAAAADKADFINSVRDIVTDLVPLQYDGTAWTDAEYSVAGSPLFFPETWASIVSNSESNPITGSSPALFAQFGGRGTDGKRVKLYLFETWLTLTPDMRWSAGENASVATALTTIGSAAPGLATKSGSQPTWRNYVNLGVNDYLTRKARG